MRAYPSDSLGVSLRNVFDFDIYKRETIDKLAEILEHHGYVGILRLLLSLEFTVSSLRVDNLGLEAAREAAKKRILNFQYEPKSTDLDIPKEGKHDDEPHEGGNTFAGGVSILTNYPRVTMPIFSSQEDETQLVSVDGVGINDHSRATI
jgi:hypothetical protein